MKIFKTERGLNPIFDISLPVFEKETGGIFPYYQKNANNESVQYAVCPQCNNHIQLIGLYNKSKNTDNPFGKHHLKNVSGFAPPDFEAYKNCIYADVIRQFRIDDRKAVLDEYSREIYYTLREQFDRVVYVLRKVCSIYTSDDFAKTLLEDFISTRGWLYPGITISNLPYVFRYLAFSKPINGRFIKKNSEIYSALSGLSEVIFMPSETHNGYERLTIRKGLYLNLQFWFFNHERKLKDDRAYETFVLEVNKVNDGKKTQVYKEILPIDETYLTNIILKNNTARRNQKLLNISKELMPDI
ncbi:hypothetical protein FACS189499_07750 [Clostridia bacterium]|nr:hypothetical protein FACS189499_07750 [Clostridia bacterium]